MENLPVHKIFIIINFHGVFVCFFFFIQENVTHPWRILVDKAEKLSLQYRQTNLNL